MIPIQGLFETHLTVRNLDRSMAFYRDIVGLPVAEVFPERHAAFHWIGAPGNAMLGLWETTSPVTLRLHFALAVSVDDLFSAGPLLREAGVVTHLFGGEPSDAPGVYGWMPAVTVFFKDPDDHSVELLSMLPGPPRPEIGAVPWSVWQELIR